MISLNPFFSVALTYIFGPIVFLLGNVGLPSGVRRFPSGAITLIGDFIALPWYNAVLFSLGFQLDIWLLFFSLVAVTVWVWWKVRIEKLVDWSFTAEGKFTRVGKYHVLFMVVQFWLVLLGITQHSQNLNLWLPVLLFFLSMIYGLGYQVPKRKSQA